MRTKSSPSSEVKGEMGRNNRKNRTPFSETSKGRWLEGREKGSGLARSLNILYL